MRVPPGVATVLSVLFVVGACSHQPTEPVHLKSVELGTGVDADNHIVAATRTFQPQSVVYVVVATEGAGPATLTVQWVASTSLVKEEKRNINPAGPARFVFQFVPPGGWPAGRNQVLFFQDTAEKHAADFNVS